MLLLDDILDTGQTLGYLVKHLKGVGVASLRVAVLLRSNLVSFGHGLYFAAGAYTVGFAGKWLHLRDAVLLILGAVVVSGALAAVLGLFLARYRGIFFGMLTLYVVLLLTISRNDRELQRMQQRFVQAIDAPAPSPARAAFQQEGARHGIYERHVAIGRGHATRPAYNGLSVIDTEEVHVVVRSARELQTATR